MKSQTVLRFTIEDVKIILSWSIDLNHGMTVHSKRLPSILSMQRKLARTAAGQVVGSDRGSRGIACLALQIYVVRCDSAEATLLRRRDVNYDCKKACFALTWVV